MRIKYQAMRAWGLLAVAFVAALHAVDAVSGSETASGSENVPGIEIVVHSKGDRVGGVETSLDLESTYQLTKRHARLVSRQRIDHIDLTSSLYRVVSFESRVYLDYPLPVDLLKLLPDPRLRPRLAKRLDGYDPTLEISRSEGTENVLGHVTTRVDVRVGDAREAVHGRLRVWIDPEIEARLADFPYLQLEHSRFAASPFTNRWMYRAISDHGGFPVRVELDYEVDGKRTRFTRTLVSIREVGLDSSDFTAPEGFERLEHHKIAKPQPLPGDNR